MISSLALLRDRRSYLTATIVALLGLGLISSTLALFTDQQVVGNNTFTTGTIDISVSPTSTFITYSNMMPGDSTTQQLTVQNAGTSQLRYAMTGSADNADGKALRDQINLVVKTQGTSCTAFDGTTLYSGALSGFVVGDPTPGAQAGDRTLNASTSEVLCFRASLPISTGNAHQNATTTFQIAFDAEQTANNP